MFPNEIIKEIFLLIDNIVDSYYFAKTNRVNYAIFKHLQAVGLKKLPIKNEALYSRLEEILYVLDDRRQGSYFLRKEGCKIYATLKDNKLTGQKIECYDNAIVVSEYREGELDGNYYKFKDSGLLIKRGVYKNGDLVFYKCYDNPGPPTDKFYIFQICDNAIGYSVIRKNVQNYLDLYQEIKKYFNENEKTAQRFKKYITLDPQGIKKHFNENEKTAQRFKKYITLDPFWNRN